MKKIAFFELEAWEEKAIHEALPHDNLLLYREKLEEKTIARALDAEIISTFIYSSLTKQALSQLPNLKYITTRSTGFDHIDLAFCKERGIRVANVPTYGAHTVAEHTFALILALSRRLIPSVERARRGDFSLNNLQGFDLYGKTIGVVGAGNIGKHVITVATGFGMNVLVYTRHSESIQENEKVRVVSLDELLSKSDIVSLHLPYNEDTRHFINAKNIHQLKKGSLLINTARGGLVETEAILMGLEQGILSGVGLDVLEEECNMKEERELLTSEFLKTCDIKTQLLNHVLLTRDNVVITPHNAFNSREALAQILDVTIANIKSFLKDQPQNLVDR